MKLEKNTKFLLDTDIGSDVDDAFALLALLKLVPERLIGVTTAYGCAELRAKIAKKLIETTGHNIPVVAGESSPLSSPQPIHLTGREGCGVLTEEEREKPLEDFGIETNAPEFIVKQVTSNPGEVILICIAPLTNIARAIEIEPKLGKYLKGLFFMGGGITFDSPTPKELRAGQTYRAIPSYNVEQDVEAAKKVISSIPLIRFITNDVTLHTKFARRRVEKFLRKKKNRAEALVANMLRVWLNYRSELFGFPVRVTYLHDVLTVAEALGMGFVSYAQGEVEVTNRGETLFTVGSGNHLVGHQVDRLSFLNWISEFFLK